MKTTFRTILFIVISHLMVTTSIAQQEGADNVMKQTVKLLEKDDWAAALKSITPLVEKHAQDGVAKFGGKFGVAIYYQGLCELKLAQQARRGGNHAEAKKRFENTVKAMQKCYAVNPDPEKDQSNIYRAKSLLLLGNAQQGLEQYEQAIKSYERFVYERNAIRDFYHLNDFRINLAICYWLKAEPEDEKAEKLFEQAIRFRGRNEAEMRSIVTGLRAMIESYTKRGKKQAIEAFILKHGKAIKVELVSAEEELPIMSKMMLEAAQANLNVVVNALAATIPSELMTELFEKNIEAELKAAEDGVEGRGQFSAVELQNLIANRNKIQIALQQAEELSKAARALCYENSGFYTGALAAYELVLAEYPKSRFRADYLYNASRTAVLAQSIEVAFERGQEFLQQFPKHKNAVGLQKMLLIALYYSQRYDKCIAIGEPIINGAEKSQLRDTALFTVGASYYYEGEFAQAAPLLKEHFEKFDKSVNRDVVSYLYASVLGKNQQYEKSIELLDGYLAKHGEEDVYYPFALYDKSFALYSQENNEQAIEVLKKFRTKFMKSIIKPSAHILLGNIYRAKLNQIGAEKEYLLAINAANETENQYSHDEAYYLLVSTLGQATWNGGLNTKIADAAVYYDEFMKGKDAVKSPFFTQIVTSAITALERAGRKEEAYAKLEEVIFQHNIKPNAAGIENALKTYFIILRNGNKTDDEVLKLIEENEHLSSIPYHLGLKIVAKLDVLQRTQRLSPTDKRAKQIDALYLKLHLEHEKKHLDNFALINIANYLSNRGGYKKEAINYYKAALASGSKIKRPEALVGVASELAKSENPQEITKAEFEFKKIIENPYIQAKPKARAHFQWISLLARQEKWKQVTVEARKYTKYSFHAKMDIRKVEMLLAISYDKQNQVNDAINAYNSVWVNSFMNLKQSAPAIERVTEIIWQRNKPAAKGVQGGKSDRQVAYETVYKYNRRTKEEFKKNREDYDQATIDTWLKIQDKIQQYGKEPGVKKL